MEQVVIIINIRMSLKFNLLLSFLDRNGMKLKNLSRQFVRRRSENEPLLLDTAEQEEIISKFKGDCERSNRFHRVSKFLFRARSLHDLERVEILRLGSSTFENIVWGITDDVSLEVTDASSCERELSCLACFCA